MPAPRCLAALQRLAAQRGKLMNEWIPFEGDLD